MISLIKRFEGFPTVGICPTTYYNMFSRVEPLLYHRKPYLSSCYYVLYVLAVWRFIQLCNKVLWAWNKAKPVLVRVAGRFWGNVL